MATTQSQADSEADSEPSNDYRESIERAAPLTVEMQKRGLKAIPELLYIAKEAVDDMDDGTREHHTFDQAEIREIERSLREKVTDARQQLDTPEDNWVEITLTAAEIVAIEAGLTEVLFDENTDMMDRWERVDCLLTAETNPHT